MRFENDLISVIIPVYNAEAYLHKCLDSVLFQTYTNLEIILINDGSHDNSGAICDEYAEHDKRVKVIHKSNGGAFVARNAGLNMAKGEFIAFVDSDDFINADMYEKMHRCIVETDADICICGFRKLYEGFERIERVPLEGKIEPDELWTACLSSFREYNYLLNILCNKLYRRELLQRNTVNPIRFKEIYRYHEDALFNYDCCAIAAHGISFIDFCPYNYFASVSGSLTKDTKYEIKEIVLNYLFDIILSALPEKKAEIEKVLKCQLSIAKIIIIHIAIINKLPIPYKLKWDTISVVLRNSRSYKEKLSALFIYFLPSSLYRAAYKLYCRSTRHNHGRSINYHPAL